MLPSFKVSDGTEHQLHISVAASIRMRDAGYDIVDVTAMPDTVLQLHLNEESLCGAIYAILQPQLNPKGVSLEQFAESLDGETIEAAREAMEAALGRFFTGQKRQLYNGVMEAIAQEIPAVLKATLEDMQTSHTEDAQMRELFRALMQVIQESLPQLAKEAESRLPGSESTKTAEPSESTPAVAS